MKLALAYDNSKTLFAMNKAKIGLEDITFDFVQLDDGDPLLANFIMLNNPYGIKLRIDKIISKIFSISRNQVRQLIKDGTIFCDKNYVGESAKILIKEDIFRLTCDISVKNGLN